MTTGTRLRRPTAAGRWRIVRRLWSPQPWRATAYLASYLPFGTTSFAGTVIVLVTATCTNITWLGLPLVLGATEIVRGCARTERRRAALFAEPVPAHYRDTHGGLLGQVRGRLADPATWRDCAYLTLLFPPLLALDVTALVIWLACLAGIALPCWYWAIPNSWHDGTSDHGVLIGYLPAGPSHGGVGIWIGSLPAALAAAAVFLIIAPFAAALLVAAARLHHRVARSLLGPYRDPLADARQVLGTPGPLTTQAPRPEGKKPWPANR